LVSAVLLILGASVPGAALGATGLNIESQAAILARLDEVGARVMTMVSIGPAPAIPATAVDRIARLDGVAWVVGLGPVIDVRARTVAGEPTPARTYRSIGAPVRFTGRTAAQGAFVSAASAGRLGLAGAYSVLDPDIAIVGWFDAEEPLTSLGSFVLIPDDDNRSMFERVIVGVDTVGWVEPVAANLGAMAGKEAATATTIERSPILLAARDAIRDEVTRRDRELVLGLLAGATAFCCLVVFAGSAATRRDFGRRRALGASRPQLIVLVMLGTLWPAVIGSALGAFAGWAYVGSKLGHVADWHFAASTCVLTSIAFVVSSALPASVAATRDPLRVLRVP
jgi:putative ABC transport system permease protein